MSLNLEQRLIRLEATNQRLRRWMLAVVVVLGLGFCLGQAAPDVDQPTAADTVQKEIVTNKLRIVDAAGKDRIECSVLGDMPVMRFLDRDGVARITVVARRDSSALEIADQSGATRTSIGYSPSGPGAMFLGEDHKPRAILSAGKDGPGLLMLDAERPRILVGVRDNEPVMAVLNRGTNLAFERQPSRTETPPIETPPIEVQLDP